MGKVLLLALAAAALALAAAKTYSFDLFEPVMLGTTELKPGHYTVELMDQRAVVRNGKIHGEAPVQMEESDKKYDRTSVVLNDNGGQRHLLEVHIGGTNRKLVFQE
jgi:hypothetical protein